jgi:hypothetical protein
MSGPGTSISHGGGTKNPKTGTQSLKAYPYDFESHSFIVGKTVERELRHFLLLGLGSPF